MSPEKIEPDAPKPAPGLTEDPKPEEDVKGQSMGDHISSFGETGQQIAQLGEATRQLQRLGPLRKDTIVALIQARERMREYSYKREQVSTSSANFMREVQTLQAQGKLAGSDTLSVLYEDLLLLRDILGPLEKDSIDAQRAGDRRLVKLIKEEKAAYTTLKSPLVSFGNDLREGGSFASEDFGSESDYDSFRFDNDDVDDLADGTSIQLESPASRTKLSSLTPPQSPSMAGPSHDIAFSPFSIRSGMDDQDLGDGMEENNISIGPSEYYSDVQTPSKIDNRLDSRPYGYSIPDFTSKKANMTNPDLYSSLLLDFKTARERVNGWLMYNPLVSRWEADILKERLDMEDQGMPSNWAQLVVAWWSKDIPKDWHPQHLETHNTARSVAETLLDPLVSVQPID